MAGGIPLFTGAADIGGGLAGVRPDSQVIQRLDPTLYGKGAADGRATPSTIGALGQAVTSGIETYQKTKTNQQVIEQNDLKLEAQRQSQPLQMETEQLALKQKRDKIAQEMKERAEEEELLGALQNGTPEQKVDVLVSGKYAGVFSRNPNLEKYATKVAAPYMPAPIADAWMGRKQYENENKRLLANQNLIQMDFGKSEAAVLANSDINQILAQNPKLNYSVDKLVDMIAFERSGEYKRDDSGEMILENGKPVKDIDVEVDGKSSYDMIDKSTGKILFPKISSETRKEIEGYVANRARLKRIGLYGNDSIVDIARAARGERVNPDMSAEPATKVTSGKPMDRQEVIRGLIQKRTRGVTTDGTVELTVEGDIPPKPLTVPDFSKSVRVLPAEVKGDRLSFESSPEASKLAALSLGVSPEIATKRSDQLAVVLDKAFKPDLSGLSNKAERDKVREEATRMKDNFITELLRDEFKSNSKVLGAKYSKEKVQEYNKNVDTVKKGIADFANGKSGGVAILPVVPSLNKVQSAEDLYIQDNFSRINSRLEALSRISFSEAQRRASENIRKGQAASNAAAMLSNMIGGR